MLVRCYHFMLCYHMLRYPMLRYPMLYYRYVILQRAYRTTVELWTAGPGDSVATAAAAAGAQSARPCRYGSGCRRAGCRYSHPPAPPAAATPAPAEATAGPSSGSAASSRYGAKLQQVRDFTCCTEQQALECLDAASGDVQHASILALDAVGHSAGGV
jgi:hypothetical protein